MGRTMGNSYILPLDFSRGSRSKTPQYSFAPLREAKSFVNVNPTLMWVQSYNQLIEKKLETSPSFFSMGRTMGIEPTAIWTTTRCSTTELRPP